MRHWRDLLRLFLSYRWDSWVALALAPLLVWTYGGRVIRYASEGGGSTFHYLLAPSGLALGIFWSYWIVSELVPRFVLEYRLRKAHSDSDWPEVKNQVERAFDRGWGSDEWMATLGQANSHLGDIEAALECYQAIESPLPTEELEYARIFNHSWCLLQLGHVAESRLVFDSVDPEAWPDAMARHVREHEEQLRNAEPDPPAIH